jgi:hypothetical protein
MRSLEKAFRNSFAAVTLAGILLWASGAAFAQVRPPQPIVPPVTNPSPTTSVPSGTPNTVDPDVNLGVAPNAAILGESTNTEPGPNTPFEQVNPITTTNPQVRTPRTTNPSSTNSNSYPDTTVTPGIGNMPAGGGTTTGTQLPASGGLNRGNVTIRPFDDQDNPSPDSLPATAGEDSWLAIISFISFCGAGILRRLRI